MNSTKGRGWLAAALVAVMLAASACSDGNGTTTTGAGTSADSEGGSIVIAAEEELATADWINRDAGLAWGVWSLGIHTLPQVFVVQPDGRYAPGAVLEGEPLLELGPPQRVTYRIRPEAVWSDGEPIVSGDFEYLWKQVTEGKAIYDQTGYSAIESIDTSDPKTAVVTFSEPFAPWRDLFSGFYFLFPSHLLEGKNRNKVMKDGYEFSGGPWKLEGGASGWDKGRSLTLVPNDRFWGVKPSIDKVTFQFIPETGPAIEAVKTGQVDAAYPTPDVGILDELEEEENLQTDTSLGNTYEALWLNTAKAPLDSRAVRQALAYATDRNVIVEQILQPSVREGSVLQSFNVPTYAEYYTPSFERYQRDVGRVEELMTGDGWQRNADGVWEKNGRTARVELNTTEGVGGRELVERLLESQWEDAGFDVRIDNTDPGTLFGEWLPEGTFVVGIFSSVGTPDPDLCISFCTSAIPSEANDGSGLNITYLSSPAIDAPLTAQSQEVDAQARAVFVRQGQDALADEVPAIPLYQAPTVFVWDTDTIGGPLSDNTTSGPFYNLNEWTLR